MKKFLLLMTLFFALGFSAKAAYYEFKMSAIYGTATGSSAGEKDWGNGITVNIQKGEGTTAPAINKAGDVRTYANNTITIKSATAKMTKIAFYISSQGKTQYSEITPSVGSIVKQGATPDLEWTGNATEVTFTVGAKNQYGSNSSKTAGQFDFTNVYITTSDEGVAVLAPTFSVAAGDVALGTEVEINCETEGAKIYYTTDGNAPTDASTLYDGAITIDEDMTIKAIAYKGADKSSVATASYTVLEAANTLAEAKKFAKGKSLLYNGDLTVVYKSGSNEYVYDGTEFALIYGSVNCKAGDVIKGGWKATVDIYGGLFELKPASTPVVEGTAEIPAPIVITAENMAETFVPANICAYCIFKNVTIAEATPGSDKSGAALNFNATVGDATIGMRNNFKLASAEPGTYDLPGFITVFDSGKNEISTDASKLQYYPTEFIEVKQDGIDGIEADTNAPVQYFNLSGMRIDNPAPGQTVIRLQAGKATKVRF